MSQCFFFSIFDLNQVILFVYFFIVFKCPSWAVGLELHTCHQFICIITKSSRSWNKYVGYKELLGIRIRHDDECFWHVRGAYMRSPALHRQGSRTVDIIEYYPLISPSVPILLRVLKMHNV